MVLLFSKTGNLEMFFFSEMVAAVDLNLIESIKSKNDFDERIVIFLNFEELILLRI